MCASLYFSRQKMKKANNDPFTRPLLKDSSMRRLRERGGEPRLGKDSLETFTSIPVCMARHKKIAPPTLERQLSLNLVARTAQKCDMASGSSTADVDHVLPTASYLHGEARSYVVFCD